MDSLNVVRILCIAGILILCINALQANTVFVEISEPIELNLSDTYSLCPGGTIPLDATVEGGSYEWQDGSAEPIFVADSPGTYSV